MEFDEDGLRAAAEVWCRIDNIAPGARSFGHDLVRRTAVETRIIDLRSMLQAYFAGRPGRGALIDTEV